MYAFVSTIEMVPLIAADSVEVIARYEDGVVAIKNANGAVCIAAADVEPGEFFPICGWTTSKTKTPDEIAAHLMRRR